MGTSESVLQIRLSKKLKGTKTTITVKLQGSDIDKKSINLHYKSTHWLVCYGMDIGIKWVNNSIPVTGPLDHWLDYAYLGKITT